jgi:hypothetical protein
VQLDPLHREGAPPHPPSPFETRRLPGLTRVQHRKQGRIDDQGLGLSYQLGQDGTPQGLQEAPQLAHSAVERGGMKVDDPWEQVREEPGTFSRKKERSDSTPLSC